MALQKTFTAKVYDQDSTTLLRNFTFSPEGERTLKDIPAFRSSINGGLGELKLDLDIAWDNVGEGTNFELMSIVDVWVVDQDNPRGRRVYRGFASQIEPYIDASGEEGVRLTCLGLVSLLTASYYKNGSGFTVAHSSQDPTVIAKAVVDHFNTIYGGSLITYNASSVPATVGTSVSLTFTDQRWHEAIKKAVETAGTDWFWHVGADGLFTMKAKPGSATHTFTVGKDIETLHCPKDLEKVINDVQVRRSGGTTSDYSSSASQTTYGTGSPATGKRTKIVSDTTLTDATAADQRGNKEINDNKDAKVKATITINTNYDLESIEVGDTCKVRNFRKGESFLSDNMIIVGLTYSGDRVRVELGDFPANFGREIVSLIGSTSSSSTSSGGGSSSTPGFVDRETPSGSINGSNTVFTLSQAPVSGSEMVYLNGVLQNGSGNDYSIASSTITTTVAPPSGSVLLVSYRTSSGSINFVDRETPSGSIDGSNATFTLAHTPTTGSLHLYLNGMLLNEGAANDFTLSGTTATLATPPPSGSVILASYRY